MATWLAARLGQPLDAHALAVEQQVAELDFERTAEGRESHTEEKRLMSTNGFPIFLWNLGACA